MQRRVCSESFGPHPFELPRIIPPSSPPSEYPIDAAAINGRLFTPSSPDYLLAAFCLPRIERLATLQQVADWFGLDDGLRVLNPDADMSRPFDDRWLELLELCAPRVSSQSSHRELVALVTALRRMTVLADRDRTSATLEQLWVETSTSLRASLPKRKGAKYDGAEPATLRGRKWQALRAELADIMARLKATITPASLVPRPARQPLMFETNSFQRIADALDKEAGGSGFVVLHAAPGSGSSELALAYADDALEQRRYERVFVLRATDPLRLEQDFIAMAAILAGKGADRADRASLRRAAFEYLENNDRWLIVFVAVHDPALLLQVMPWRQGGGHILCTYATPNADLRSEDLTDDPWATYFHVEPSSLLAVSAEAFDAAAQLARELPRSVHDDRDFAAVVEAVGESRHATALALAWFRFTTSGEPNVEAARAQLRCYLQRWEKASELTGGSVSASERAAMVQILELDEPAEWRRPRDRTTEKDTVELLCRLIPFVDPPLDASSFQTAILTKERYAVGVDRIKDERIVLLEDLALADRAVGAPVRKYFNVNAATLRAVQCAVDTGALVNLPVREDARASAQANAASTMARILHQPPMKREVPELTFELLPHISALAKREQKGSDGSAPARPLFAAELYAYSALCHLDRGRSRTARQQLNRMREVFDSLPGDVPIDAEQLEDWKDATDEKRDRVAKRFGKLVKVLRMTGFPQAAITVFERVAPHIDPQLRLKHQAETAPEIARLRFEAALAYRDLGDAVNAAAQLDLAEQVWTEPSVADGKRLLAMAKSYEAELAFDSGNFVGARAEAESALETRKEQLKAAASDDKARHHADIARSFGFIGRINYVESQTEEALESLKDSIDHWEQAFSDAAREQPLRCIDRINQISTRSYLALVQALLGDIPSALAGATTARYDLRATTHRPHAAAEIKSNIAQVYRLSGRVGDAKALHNSAADDAARAWGRKHTRARLVRRKQADTLLAAGQPDDALQLLREQLFVNPEAMPLSPGALLRVARTWSSLGRLLLENSLSGSDADRTYLDLAEHAFFGARQRYQQAAGDQALNPGVIGCLIGLSEIALRQGKWQQAIDLAQEAVDRVEQQLGERPPVVAIRARLIRSRAMQGRYDQRLIRELEDEFEPMLATMVYSPADRFEIALTRAELRVAAWEITPDADGGIILSDIKNWLEDALTAIIEANGTQPHQLLARVYGELALLADRLGLPGQQRARNERERERLRPAFNPNRNELWLAIGSSLGPQPVATSAFG